VAVAIRRRCLIGTSSDSSAAPAALLEEENPFMGLSSDSSVGRAGDCSNCLLSDNPPQVIGSIPIQKNFLDLIAQLVRALGCYYVGTAPFEGTVIGKVHRYIICWIDIRRSYIYRYIPGSRGFNPHSGRDVF